MSFAKVHSAQNSYLRSHIIDVEVDLSEGMHSFGIVGLPDKAVEEARDRIGAALKNSGFTSPKNSNKKVVVALAPADIKKEGTLFDVAMALAYLRASKEIEFNPEGKIFMGELSLDGEVRPVQGILAIARHARSKGIRQLYVPEMNAREAALIDGIEIYAVRSLHELYLHLNESKEKAAQRICISPTEKTLPEITAPRYQVDLADIKGQESAKRGLEIAAAGGHNIAMFGPPGTGKTMLAKAFCSLLPALDFEHVLEATAIHSIAGTLKEEMILHPPFRSPHHTSSYVSLVGGGTFPKPGEVTLAHHGVLFLDEFPEFDRRVVDSLRQPLEERIVSVSRAKGTAVFPADFILVAAMNPCPCGNYGIANKVCTCPSTTVQRYQRKISGPIVDRIDMWLEVSKVEHDKFESNMSSGENSAQVRARVEKAREVQTLRFGKISRTNAQMSVKEIEKLIVLGAESQRTMSLYAKKLDLSARSYHRVLRLSRTIADVDGCENIEPRHILEAVQYRPKKIAA